MRDFPTLLSHKTGFDDFTQMVILADVSSAEFDFSCQLPPGTEDFRIGVRFPLVRMKSHEDDKQRDVEAVRSCGNL